jgi:murein endopeptidase
MRAKASYCDERTPDQLRYQQAVASGKISDPLKFLEADSQRRVQQSYCSVGDGFLAWGKPIIGTPENRILVKNPERCVNYGTNSMVAVLEWLGKQVADRYQGEDYAGVRLVVGNLSAPRGGCLSGMSGKRGHSSHTSGRDADLALFSAKRGRSSPEIFQTYLDPEPNFWLLQEAFSNPVACVKVVFLDKRHIRTLAKWANKSGQSEAWARIAKYVKHVRGHRNHIHLRVGDLPGPAGCMTSEPWSTEDEEEGFEGDSDLETDDSEDPDSPGQEAGEIAEILRSMGARPLKPQESKLKGSQGQSSSF